MNRFRPGRGYPAPRCTEDELRAIKLPDGPAPGATAPVPTPQPEIVWQYAGIDLDEPDGILTYDGTPRVITRRTLRRPLVPAGPWEPALHIAPECTTTNQRVHADCDGCECPCHTPETP